MIRSNDPCLVSGEIGVYGRITTLPLLSVNLVNRQLAVGKSSCDVADGSLNRNNDVLCVNSSTSISSKLVNDRGFKPLGTARDVASLAASLGTLPFCALK